MIPDTRLNIIAGFACSLFLSACIQESAASGQNPENCVTATFQEKICGNRLMWEKGDLIGVNGIVYEASESGSKVEFSPTGNTVKKAECYMAVIPQSMKVEGSSATGRLASDQTWSGGILSVEQKYGIAKSEITDFHFYLPLCYICIGIETDGITGIQVETAGGEAVSGDFTVDFSKDKPEVRATGSKNSVTLWAGDKHGTDTFAPGGKYFLAILPNNVVNVFSVTFIFDKSHKEAEWTETYSGDIYPLRGQTLDLGTFYYDTSTSSGLIIDGPTFFVDCTSEIGEINPLLFSSFSEHHGGDLVPGIYEQYIVNPSFETWYNSAPETKSELLFPDTPEISGIAYPWTNTPPGSGTSYYSISDDCVNTDHAQKISVTDGSAYLSQKLALPTYRTSTYNVSFFARKESGKDVVLEAFLTDCGTSATSGNIYRAELDNGWSEYTIQFTPDSPSSKLYGRYGLYYLTFRIKGTGTVLLDQINLFPSDCIEGIFNPETLENFKKYGIRGIRWPGGNYTSGYHWKNAIGDKQSRKVTPNRSWNGLDNNCFGTDEFLKFCELAGVTPIMGVGFGELTVREIADWVEYCNGPASTPMGALRASNGHPEPYNVKYWGVGNEVYGDYQIGHTDAGTYAAEMIEICKAMKIADPDIVIIGSAYGIHNSCSDPDNLWNYTVVPALSGTVDMFDAHNYTYGPDNSVTAGISKEDNFRIFSAAGFTLRDYIEKFRKLQPGDRVQMASLEWGILPKGGKNTPKRTTFTNMLCSAVQYNEMIRNCDVIKLAAMHNFSFYVAPQKVHSEPVNARTYLFREFSKWGNAISLNVKGYAVPEYSTPANYIHIGQRDNVGILDVTAAIKDGKLYICIISRCTENEQSARFMLPGINILAANGRTYTSPSPYSQYKWSDNTGLEPSIENTETTEVNGSSISVKVPAMSITFLELETTR